MSRAADSTSRHPLAHVRQSRGWTLGDLAEIVSRRSGLNMSTWRQKVNRWERRNVVPEPAAQYALADELGVPRAIVERFGWPQWLLTVDAVEDPGEPWTTGHAQQVLSRVMESAVFDRRGFLVMSGGLLTAAATTSLLPLSEPVQAATEGGAVGSELLAALRARVVQMWGLDAVLGGGACVAAAASDLQLVGTVLARAGFTGTVEAGLYSVAAAIAQFAGFAAFDGGRHAAAQRFWHAGLRAAHTAADRGETVHLLTNLALQDIYVNHGREAVGMLEAARSKVDPAHKTVLSLLDCWQARAHAERGERREVARLLNRADDTYGKRRPGDDPAWIYWMRQPTMTAEAGAAMRLIGEPAHAQRMFVEGMPLLRKDASRDHNLYLVRIAELQLEAGDADEAADTMQRVQTDPPVESARVTTHIHALKRRYPAVLAA